MKVGVIGAGTMGNGIAQAFAVNENIDQVFLCDIKQEYAEKGKKRVDSSLDHLVEKGKITPEEKQDILGKIRCGTKRICGEADLIVEAAVEDLEIKNETFNDLDKICKPECIFTTNTSSLSITAIMKGIGRPVCGMHFFNPAQVMKLVEVTPGLNTPDRVVERVMEISTMIGKTPIRVEEDAGFVVNRLLVPMINEAIGIYARGDASVEDIDLAMRLGANHKMGPLALGDLIGLDVCLAIMEVIYTETLDSKYRPEPLLRKMVRGNKLGRKTGEGFYKYE